MSEREREMMKRNEGETETTWYRTTTACDKVCTCESCDWGTLCCNAIWDKVNHDHHSTLCRKFTELWQSAVATKCAVTGMGVLYIRTCYYIMLKKFWLAEKMEGGGGGPPRFLQACTKNMNYWVTNSSDFDFCVGTVFLVCPSPLLDRMVVCGTFSKIKWLFCSLFVVHSLR
jgi:hypothetical protein